MAKSKNEPKVLQINLFNNLIRELTHQRTVCKETPKNWHDISSLLEVIEVYNDKMKQLKNLELGGQKKK